MNESQNMQSNGFVINDTAAGYRPHFSPKGSVPANLLTVDIRLERLQLYVTHLEAIILSRHSEISDLNSILDARIEEMLQKQLEHEHIMIHQARRAAMGDALGIIAHKWRQPLNAISLSVQNLTDAWEYGVINEELLNRSTFRVMEQVNLLSQTIDDYRSYINPSGSTEHFNPIQRV